MTRRKSTTTYVNYAGEDISVRVIYQEGEFHRIEIYRNVTTGTPDYSRAFVVGAENWEEFVAILNDIASDLIIEEEEKTK